MIFSGIPVQHENGRPALSVFLCMIFHSSGCYDGDRTNRNVQVLTVDSPYHIVIDSPVGPIGIRVDGDAVVAIDFLDDTACIDTESNDQTAPLRRIAAALDDYFSGDLRRSEGIRLKLNGTAHQLKVWQALGRIPAGQTRTYGDLARELGSSPRAVGNACRSNPVPILIPCHRVVAANGAGGFMGATGGRPLSIKQWLLRHEQGA